MRNSIGTGGHLRKSGFALVYNFIFIFIFKL